MKKVLLAALAVVCFALPAKAEFVAAPGLWETKVTFDMPGMKMPGQTSRQCVTAEDIEDPEAAFARGQDGTCTLVGSDIGDSYIRYQMACNEGTVSVDGEMNFTETAYTGKAVMTMGQPGMTMTTNFSGTRIGDCE